VNAARTRIGRVKMKAGGADLRVLHRDPQSFVIEHAREWLVGLVDTDKPPNAYAAVAFWVDADNPGHPGYRVTYCTRTEAMTPAVLVRCAAEQIRAEHSTQAGSERALEKMGYEPEDWKPDGAA
jgi:hypothetical protein